MSANNTSLPNELGLDFTEPEYPKSTQDEIMFNQFMLDNNLTSGSKLLKSYNKDLTIEQAKSLINENKIENKVEDGQEQSIIQRLRQRTETA